MDTPSLCPFSKPIIGNFCHCPHAIVTERCSGKMSCRREAELWSTCSELATRLIQKAHFVLGLSGVEAELTHAQLMKIRCGGVLGMARELGLDDHRVPQIREVITAAMQQYGRLADFPYSQIMPAIQGFSHRSKK